MLAFLGLSVLIGAVYKPRIPMHWSTNAIYQTYIFPSVMPRDRILLILRFLDFADNSAFNASNPNRDRLWKIREFTQMVHQRCKEVFTPGRDLCVDESLLLFKGRLGFKQFIKTKRVRFGIKLFELCTKTSILLDFLVYSGDMTKELITVPERDFLMSEPILLMLMQPYLQKGYRLFVDNFYIPHASHSFCWRTTPHWLIQSALIGRTSPQISLQVILDAESQSSLCRTAACWLLNTGQPRIRPTKSRK